MIETYISEHGSDPVNGEELSVDDLIDLKQSRTVKPRPPQLTSIPALLSTFQNEWDALVLETYQLKKQLGETRQELSNALYYNDSAQRVIARLQQERDEARDALSRVSVTGGANGVNGTNGDAMQIDGAPLSDEVVARITETQERLSSTRRKRPVPTEWATADEIQTYDVKGSIDTQFTGAKFLAADHTGDFFLCGDSDGAMAIYDLQAGAFTTRSNLGAGAILGGGWCNDKPAVATSSGVVAIAEEGAVKAKFHQHAGAATAVAGHPSGEILVSVGVDKSYVLYDIHASKVATQVYGDVGKLYARQTMWTTADLPLRTFCCRLPPRRTPSRSWWRGRECQTVRRQGWTARTHIPSTISCKPSCGYHFLRKRNLVGIGERGSNRGNCVGSSQAQCSEDTRHWYCSDRHLVGLHRPIPGG